MAAVTNIRLLSSRRADERLDAQRKRAVPDTAQDDTFETPLEAREPLNLVKMAVGIDSVAHLRQIQRERWGDVRPYRHFTRHRPKREREIASRGSLVWVIRGVIRVRQPIVGFEVGPDLEGRIRCGILLEPVHILVEPRSMRPFQGWRYLTGEATPPDLPEGSAEDDLPSPEMLNELRRLGLI